MYMRIAELGSTMSLPVLMPI